MEQKYNSEDEPENMPWLSPKEVKHIQEVIGTFLWYSRAVDSTMQVTLSAIAADQNKATEKMKAAVNQFLDYAATNPNAIMQFHKSNMKLWIHSDASYLNEPEAHSQIRGHFYLGNNMNETDVCNGAININTTVSDVVISSAAESEVGALFLNTKEGTGFWTTLAKLGHSQNATPIQTNNTTALGIANQKIKQRWLQAMDMQFYWVQDRVKQGQFHIYFGPSNDNLCQLLHKTSHSNSSLMNATCLLVHNNKRASIECLARVWWNPSQSA